MSLQYGIPLSVLIVRLLGREFTLFSDFSKGSLTQRRMQITVHQDSKHRSRDIFGGWTGLCKASCKLLLLKGSMPEGGRGMG